MFSSGKKIPVAVLSVALFALTNNSANAGTMSVDEIMQQQLDRTCEVIGKSIAMAMGLKRSEVKADYSADPSNKGGLCFISKGDETLARIAANADGDWDDPY